ncbi:MFS transporter [Streptomyces sp. NPDC048434]|uniref:MFS transporter n=1 Tax=Streptomyces sp. NPDC048434 TaxID=3365549 RepID=UPI0037193E84
MAEPLLLDPRNMCVSGVTLEVGIGLLRHGLKCWNDLAVYVLRHNLPESPRWLATHKPQQALAAMDRIEKTAGLPVTGTFPAASALGLGREGAGERSGRPKLWGPALRRRTLLVCLMETLGPVGFYGFASIVPAGLLTTLMSVINATVSRTYGAELFPTEVRNTALGRTYSLSRLVAAILPFCTLPVLDTLGAGPVYLSCACIITLMALAVAMLGPRTNAVALEGI